MATARVSQFVPIVATGGASTLKVSHLVMLIGRQRYGTAIGENTEGRWKLMRFDMKVRREERA